MREWGIRAVMLGRGNQVSENNLGQQMFIDICTAASNTPGTGLELGAFIDFTL